MSNQMKEIPCPHCGQDLRLPAECNLETWNALREAVTVLDQVLSRPGVQALTNTP